MQSANSNAALSSKETQAQSSLPSNVHQKQAKTAWALSKNLMKRFLGCWIAYFCAWLLVTAFPLSYVAISPVEIDADEIANLWNFEYVICLAGITIGAFAAASCVFKYAFKRNEADFCGSLPLKRTVLFASVAAAGFVPLVVVEALVAVVLSLLALSMPSLGMDNCATWFCLALIYTFVLYAVALLCVQLAGTVGGAAWLYVGANLFIVLVEMALRFLAGMMIWGLDIAITPQFFWTSPVGGMSCYQFQSDDFFINWQRLAWYCAAAAVCVLIAWRLNEHRPFERAGEIVVYKPIRVLFCCAFGVMGALVLGLCSALILENAVGSPFELLQSAIVGICMGAGGFLGTMSAGNYARSSANRPALAWKPALAVGLAMCCFCLACGFDVLGIGLKTPSVDQVKSVNIKVSVNQPFYNRQEVELESAAAVTQVKGLQQEMFDLEKEAQATNDEKRQWTTVAFTYVLQNGETTQRSYRIPPTQETIMHELNDLFNSEEGVDSRLDILKEQNPADVEILYTAPENDDGGIRDDAYALTNAEKREFIAAPLTSDAHEHDALHLDLSQEDSFASGQLGNITIYDASAEGGRVGEITIPLSRKDTPAIAQWLEQNNA